MAIAIGVEADVYPIEDADTKAGRVERFKDKAREFLDVTEWYPISSGYPGAELDDSKISPEALATEKRGIAWGCGGTSALLFGAAVYLGLSKDVIGFAEAGTLLCTVYRFGKLAVEHALDAMDLAQEMALAQPVLAPDSVQIS